MAREFAENMGSFLNPKSLAVIGASGKLGTIAGRPIKYLLRHGYPGRLYPVNPNYEEIAGLKCYRTVRELPEAVDNAMVIVRADRVLDILRDCASRGIKNAVVVSSGFAEVGGEGREKQEQLRRLAEETGLRICGPNCQGFINLKDGVLASFSGSLDMHHLRKGGVGFVSQSGAFGYSTFSLALENGIGFKYVVSTGNEVDLDACDFMRYMLEDPDVHLVAGYIEGIRYGEKFVALAKLARKTGKPLVILKVGRTSVGQQAALSHTGAMTGSDAVLDGVCQQYGVLRVRDVEEFFDLAKIFAIRKPAVSRKVGILSTSGGAAVMMADELMELGLSVPELNEGTKGQLRKVVPYFGSVLNPVDVTAEVLNDPRGFRTCLEVLAADPEIGAIGVIITMVTGALAERLAEDIRAVNASSPKPIVAAWPMAGELAGTAFEILEEAGVPFFKTPVRAARALARWTDYRLAQTPAISEMAPGCSSPMRSEALAVLEQVRSENTEYHVKRLLSLYGIPVVKEFVATSAEDAVRAAAEIGYPVALKILSPQIRHKTESGGVRLGLRNPDEVRGAYEDILASVRWLNPEARTTGVLVQEMVTGGFEVILGGTNDPQFGPVIMFGSGGVLVELLRDTVYRLPPLTYSEALDLLKRFRGAPILGGFRGRPALDEAALAEALVRFSELVSDLSAHIREVEINPLVVLEKGRGVRALDALLNPA